jgi:hypothetical protein
MHRIRTAGNGSSRRELQKLADELSTTPVLVAANGRARFICVHLWFHCLSPPAHWNQASCETSAIVAGFDAACVKSRPIRD